MFRQPTVESLGNITGREVEGTEKLQPDDGAPPSEAGGDGGSRQGSHPGIAEDGFGLLLHEPTEEGGLETGDPITRYTFTNKNGLSVQVINYGVTVTSIVVPDRNGVFDDIALGFDDVQGYLNHANYFIGSTVGRVANIVSRARFQMDRRMYELSVNDENIHKHGGRKGFAQVVWSSYICKEQVVFTHLSADGEDGYPGNLMVTIKMSLGDDNALRTVVTATTDRPTPVNIGNHACFNLAGHMRGPEELGSHVVVLNSDKWLCVNDDDNVPTGEIKHVGCTLMDLRIHRVLSRLLPLVPYGGFDHTFIVNGARQDGVRFVGRVLHPRSGRVLEIFSDQPAVHFYSGKNLGYPYVEEPVDEEAELAGASMENQTDGEPEHDPELELEEDAEPAAEPVAEPVAEPQEEEAQPPAEGEGEPVIDEDQPPVDEFAEVTDEDARSVNLEDLEPIEDTKPKRPEMLGKSGALYEKNGCFSLMTQGYTDAMNKHHFPEVIVRPGETYVNTTILKFAVCVKTRKWAAEALVNSPEPSIPSPQTSRHSGDSRQSYQSGTTRPSGDETPYAAFEEDGVVAEMVELDEPVDEIPAEEIPAEEIPVEE